MVQHVRQVFETLNIKSSFFYLPSLLVDLQSKEFYLQIIFSLNSEKIARVNHY